MLYCSVDYTTWKLNMLEMSNFSVYAHVLGEGAHTGNFSLSSLKENSFGIVSPAGFCLQGHGYMNEWSAVYFTAAHIKDE